MYILDKNKDYYDYFSHIYGEDKSITFDRRGSIIIKDENFVNMHDLEYSSRYREQEQFIVLEVGTVQYLIRLFKFVTRPMEYIGSKEFVSCKMEVVQTTREHKNRFGLPISIRRAALPYNGFFYRQEKPNYSEYEVKESLKIDLPILTGTQITSLIPPEEIWRELSNYISSLKNDKNTVAVPDIQKVVNHGFDKKESFRKIN